MWINFLNRYLFSRTNNLVFLLTAIVTFHSAVASTTIPLTVDENIAGAPQLIGIPFPEGEIYSPEKMRLLTEDGKEIPSQITIVNTWAPKNNSIKWIWLFFFTESTAKYQLEYGEDVKRAPYSGPRISVENNQRSYGRVLVNTGPLRFTVGREGGGFLDIIQLDTDGSGFDEEDIIARADTLRGTFLDILDSAGIDASRAVVKHTVKEKGSGPLHAIIRIEGEYTYQRADNNPSPFVIRIHAYAGKSYLRILHSIVYTGEPDLHGMPEGQYAAIATQGDNIIDQQKLKDAEGWTEPNDQIASAGISLDLNLNKNRKVSLGFYDGTWHQPGDEQVLIQEVGAKDNFSLRQTGPEPLRVPPLTTSSDEKRKGKFESQFTINRRNELQKDRVAGWLSLEDNQWGVGMGMRYFFEEYPKEIAFEADSNRLYSYIWSPQAVPLGFPRADADFDSGMIGNFAQGLAKTTEKVLYFYPAGTSVEEIRNVFTSFLDPPVTHADPAWYANAQPYGKMAPSNYKYAEYERGLDYKFEWMKYNQEWEPWYGLLDFGDGKTIFKEGEWNMWNNNEPATDFMWWLQFMRTGNRDYYLSAWADSQHTMDVDNIHWPTYPEYRGDTNDALEYFISADPDNQKGTPYLGMGRRHADQHYTSLLSAHVWITGWIASYYIAGNHRGLEIAEMSGDYYIRRVFGDHGLRGRRLYLSVWNLVELYDATKKVKYKEELDDRVRMMLELQKDSDQNGSLVIDRYGYSQVYVSLGLDKYFKITGDSQIRQAMITHAKWLRDNPPINHKMESYLSSIHSLLVGYEYSGETSFLEEAVKRSEVLKTDELSREISSFSNQKKLAASLEEVSHLPEDLESSRGAIWKFTNGLRVFGWTHIYNIPSLVYWLDHENGKPRLDTNDMIIIE